MKKILTLAIVMTLCIHPIKAAEPELNPFDGTGRVASITGKGQNYEPLEVEIPVTATGNTNSIPWYKSKRFWIGATVVTAAVVTVTSVVASLMGGDEENHSNPVVNSPSPSPSVTAIATATMTATLSLLKSVSSSVSRSYTRSSTASPSPTSSGTMIPYMSYCDSLWDDYYNENNYEYISPMEINQFGPFTCQSAYLEPDYIMENITSHEQFKTQRGFVCCQSPLPYWNEPLEDRENLKTYYFNKFNKTVALDPRVFEIWGAGWMWNENYCSDSYPRGSCYSILGFSEFYIPHGDDFIPCDSELMPPIYYPTNHGKPAYNKPCQDFRFVKELKND